MSKKQIRKIAKAAPGILGHLPKYLTKPTPRGTQGVNTPQPSQQTPLKAGIQAPNGWIILEEPLIYPIHPNVLFVTFQDPNFVTLDIHSMQQLQKLKKEVATLTSVTSRKIIIEMPPQWTSQEVKTILVKAHSKLKAGGGNLVLLYLQWHPQATAMTSSPTFPILIARDRNDAISKI